MAERGRRSGFVMTEEHRSKIANSQILNALMEHAMGKREMSATQVQAGIALMKKVLPDLASVDVSGETEVRHTIVPTIPTQDEWEAEHARGH